MTPLRQRMLEELQRRNYSPSTTRGYILAVRQFTEYFHASPERLGAEDVRRFQRHLLNEKKLAPGTVGIRMSALRFLYRKTLKRRDIGLDDLIFPKTPQKLPVVLSPEEVTRMMAPGTDLRTIQLLMGHAHLEQTTVYLHLSQRHLHAAINPLDQITITNYGETRESEDNES